MVGPQQLTGYLCIIALVAGNLLGWAHVGCVHGVITTQQSQHENSEPERADVKRVHCCSRHGCRFSAKRDTQPGPKTDHRDCPAEGGDCGHEHDSDRCSICQGFLDCRSGVTTFIIAEFSSEAPTASIAFRSDAPFAEAWQRELVVRGPPRV
ncbi:MAG: hypothetical protein AAF802_19705 [Planctomycetota bacterium]